MAHSIDERMQSADPEPSTKSRVEPLHASVAGRARLRVPGLYRSAALAAQLEQVLQAHPSIESVRASTRTGNVLVRFEPELGLDAV